MTTIAVTHRISHLWQASIGKKVVVAVTGLALFGFVIGHLLGNLLIFVGPEALDGYARGLRDHPVLLWGARIGLLVAVLLHIWATISLTIAARAARPERYRKHTAVASTAASRSMAISGVTIAVFVVYHLLHMTFGTVHPDFEELAVYHNMIAGLRVMPVAIAYVAAVGLLGFHLRHGIWSMWQTLGLAHPRYTPKIRLAAAVVAAVIVGGYISIPIAVLTGLVG